MKESVLAKLLKYFLPLFRGDRGASQETVTLDTGPSVPARTPLPSGGTCEVKGRPAGPRPVGAEALLARSPPRIIRGEIKYNY